MMKQLSAAVLLSLLVTACNTTPERRLDDALPSQATRPVIVVPSGSPSAVPSTIPSTTPASPVAISPSAVPSQAPVPVLKQGSFQNGVHRVSGRGLIIESEGKRYARLEDFSTENGPDLYLYLVRRTDGSPKGEADFISLGRLRGTTGNQNYEIPAGTDLSGFQAMTIWCRAFSVNFGYAPLP